MDAYHLDVSRLLALCKTFANFNLAKELVERAEKIESYTNTFLIKITLKNCSRFILFFKLLEITLNNYWTDILDKCLIFGIKYHDSYVNRIKF